ncbi:MAG: AAA family ATPase, partial [Chloroflexus sp.]
HASQPDRGYVTLDDPLILQLARSDPALFLQRFPPPVLIDEIQYAPGLLPLIKLAVDRAGANGLFWLTGSHQFHLMQDVSESLAQDAQRCCICLVFHVGNGKGAGSSQHPLCQRLLSCCGALASRRR